MRIVGGALSGRRFAGPKGDATRPTAERVREAMFSALAARGAVEGQRVLDLYAGTGALAVEALSRGAARAVLVEHDRREAAVARRNLEHTGFTAVARVLATDVARFLTGAPPAEAPFGLVCCDPPYEAADPVVDAVLAHLATPGWLAPGALVVVERPVGSALGAPPAWEPRFARTYGDTLVHLLSARV